MYKIVRKKSLNPTVSLMEIEVPLIAKKAQPGQFIILRADDQGERIPLTVADYDREKGTVTIIYQIVGATTEEAGPAGGRAIVWHDFVGPLGTPSHTEGLKKVAVVGGGVGCAIAYPDRQKAARRRAARCIPSSASATRIWSFWRKNSRRSAIDNLYHDRRRHVAAKRVW